MTKKQIEAMMAKQKEVSNTTQFLNTEMGQYAYQLGFENGVDYAFPHQWVSVEDELPPINKETNKSEKCFVRGDGAYGVTYQSAEYNEDRKCWEGFTFSPDNITHWMPIPPLVEEGGEK